MKPRPLFFALAASLTGIASSATFTWNNGITAVWNSDNWGGGTPNAAGDIARYTSTTDNATTTLNVNATVGQLLGNNPGKLWTINPGGGVLTLDNTGGSNNVFGNANAAISATAAAADGEAIRVGVPILIANTDLDIGSTNGGMTVPGSISASTNRTLTLRNNVTQVNRHVVVSGNIGLSGTGTIALVNSGTKATNIPDTSSSSGVLLSGILGTQVTGITHNGPGGLFITGVNRFTGPISISSASTPAMLGISSDAALGNAANVLTLDNAVLGNLVVAGSNTAYSTGGNVNLPATRSIVLGAGGGALRAGYSNLVTVNGVISGTGNLDRTDGSILALNGANTYTGITRLGGGTTRVSAINNGGVAGNLGAASNSAANLVFTAASTVHYVGATASTDRSFTLNTGITGIWDVLRADANLTLSGSVPTSTGGLTKNGQGVLTLSGANLYTGTTTVNFGTLAVTGTLASPLLIGGATLTGSGTTTGNITFNNVAGVGILASPSGITAVRGANLVLNGTTDIYTSQLGDYTAGGSGAVNVLRYTGTQSGTGAFIPQTNYRSGLLTNASGAVTLEYKAEAKTWSATTGGTWDLNTSTPWTGTADSLFFWGDAVTFGDTAADQTVTLAGNLAPSAIVVNNAANTYTFAGTGTIRGSTSILKSGAGTLALNNTGASTFTGGVIISSGTVTTNQGTGTSFANTSIVLGDANTAANAVAFLTNGTTANATLAKPIIVTPQGTGTATIGTAAASADSVSFTALHLYRPTILRNGATAANRVNFRNIAGSVGTLTIGAPATSGNRVVFEAGDNYFTGDLVINSNAVLQLGTAGTVFDTIPDGSNVTVNGTLNLSFSSVGETINGLNGSGSIGTNSSTNNTLTIGAANGGGTFSGQITQGGTGSPALSLRKVGTGTQILSGSTGNNYSGTTTVDGGTLTLSKSGGFGNGTCSVGLGNLTVNPGATVTTTVPFGIDGRNASTGTRTVTINGGTVNLAGSEYIQNIVLIGGTLNCPTAANDFLRAPGNGLNISSNAAPVTSTVNNKVDMTNSSLTVTAADGPAAIDLEFTGAISQNTGAGSGARTLTKNGAGTARFSGAHSYTGDTTVNAGVLSFTQTGLASTSSVNIASAAVLDLAFSGTNTVDKLFINGVQQLSGTWGSTLSGADHQDDVHFSGTGKLTVASAPVPYLVWAANKGLTAGNNGKADNPDNDGLNNLGEFALDGSPLSGTSDAKTAIRQTAGGPTITLPVRKNAGAFVADADGLLSPLIDGVRYRVQASTDLVDWNMLVFETAPDSTGLPALSDSNGWEYRTFQIASGNPKAFLRVKISE
ncbi:autotransporter-associated beta strand repeat-containing protein [Luteolibacter ambystomatis]|uniref:Autotransporter-associated beta strand repeat-containing protein n=1 Tax=Luteolibacter ambystomatis TaxID=2824561 RepID=A0A975G9M9_9BACT|nr:autotransporter-associated beta strand repeat-containing protein [Luteolibacter ambystomatis]QUE51341.1 autotransporter-associated beta strand repeat-containing protein [Luteolibacter ambystomatis]